MRPDGDPQRGASAKSAGRHGRDGPDDSPGPLAMVLGAVLYLVLTAVVALVVTSPLFYPPARAISCYQYDVFPAFAVELAEWYTRLFIGIYGGLGCTPP